MAQWETCDIKFEEVGSKDLITFFEWQALSPSGEIIFAVEYKINSLAVDIDLDKVRKEEKKKAHDQLINFLKEDGWQIHKGNPDGWHTQMRRQKSE